MDEVDRVFLSPRPLDVSAGDLPRANAGSLIIHVGRMADAGLPESAIGAVADDPSDLALWNRLVREVRSSAHKGAAVVNPTSGARQDAPSHRHMAEAHQLAAVGVPMLAAAGWNVFEFDDVST